MSEPRKPVPWTEAVVQLLRQWEERARTSSQVHYASSLALRSRHELIGMTAVILTTVLSTNVMDTIQARLDLTWSVVLDVAVVLAGALAAIQIFLRYDGRSDSHRVAAREWDKIRADITETLLLLVEEKAQLRGDPKSYLDQLRDRMDTVAKDSPPIGDADWSKAARTLPY